MVLLKSALSPVAVLASPPVLLKRANAPLAVLPPPVVLLKSAPAPIAVLLICSICKERSGANTRVEAAVGDAYKRKIPIAVL